MSAHAKRRSATCIRLPEALHDRIEAESKSRGVPMNWLITRLLAEGVERLIPADEMRLTRDAADHTERNDER